MNAEQARLALQLIERVNLAGAEVDAYLYVRQGLQAVIRDAQQAAPVGKVDTSVTATAA